MLHAIEALQAWHGALPRPVTVLLVSDEEVGSRSSRKITESLARHSAAVLVLEPAAGTHGAVKTARKGVGEYKLTLRRSCRACWPRSVKRPQRDPRTVAADRGTLARSTARPRNLRERRCDPRWHALKRIPDVPSRSWICARIKSSAPCARSSVACAALRPPFAGAKLTGGWLQSPASRRPRMSKALYARAARRAENGSEPRPLLRRGGSDGNFTAAIGIPTLDGMGGVGGGAHAIHEYITISELPRRTLLLAAMIENS